MLFVWFTVFLKSQLTTEAMRILRFAGVFTVALRQGECGRKTSEMHVSQQVCIGVCWQQWLSVRLYPLFNYNPNPILLVACSFAPFGNKSNKPKFTSLSRSQFLLFAAK